MEVDSCLGRVCPRSFSTRTVGVVGGSRRTTNHTPRIGTLHHLVTGYLFEEFMILIRRIYDGRERLPLKEGGNFEASCEETLKIDDNGGDEVDAARDQRRAGNNHRW